MTSLLQQSYKQDENQGKVLRFPLIFVAFENRYDFVFIVSIFLHQFGRDADSECD